MNNPQETEQMSPDNENPPPPAKIQYPPGYRFMPTDTELVMEYLMKKINNEPIPIAEINETYLRLVSPKELTEKFPKIGDNEWYFFTPRDRKYPNGKRPDRGSESGYWKATGADKNVMYKDKVVGFRKALVFYQGKPQKGQKTNWIMHEFRVDGCEHKKRTADDMRLDDWVLCRLYEKATRVMTNKQRKANANGGDAEDEINPLQLQVVSNSNSNSNDNADADADAVEDAVVAAHRNDDNVVNKYENFPVPENQYPSCSYNYHDYPNPSNFGEWSINNSMLLPPPYDSLSLSLPSMEDPVLINGGQFQSYSNYDDYGIMINPPVENTYTTTTYLNEEAVGFQQPNDPSLYASNSYPPNNTSSSNVYDASYKHNDVEGGNKRFRYNF